MPIKAYKGFDKNLCCRGFQFKEGETYETDEATLCKSGFHACLNPLDCFKYYPPATSEFREVELDDVSDERVDDTKVCAKKIKIGSKINIAGIVNIAFDFVKSKCTNENNATKGKAASAGFRGAASAGFRGAASAGDSGAASAGVRGAASAGFRGAASAGEYGAASAGFRGAASAGDYGAASAGEYGAASAGFRGAASAGFRGAASAGDYGAASAGFRGAASAGDSGAASAGEYGAAVSRGTASTDKNGLSVVRGNGCKAKGGIGTIIVIVNEYDFSYDIAEWKAGVIDGENLKPDTWYKLEKGEFVECEGEE